MGRLLIFFGVVLIIIGILLQVFPKMFGKLPGDLVFHKGNVTVYFPFMTMVIISIIFTIVINIFIKFFK
ncbi:MAG: DUF2905 domain-containing protein [Spirochaetota bacterium]